MRVAQITSRRSSTKMNRGPCRAKLPAPQMLPMASSCHSGLSNSSGAPGSKTSTKLDWRNSRDPGETWNWSSTTNSATNSTTNSATKLASLDKKSSGSQDAQCGEGVATPTDTESRRTICQLLIKSKNPSTIDYNITKKLVSPLWF